MKKRFTTIFVAVFMVVMAAACGGSAKVSNAPAAGQPSISKLAFGKNETADPPMTTFAIEDGIFVVATVANATTNLTVDFTVNTEKVKGKDKGWNIMNKLADVTASRPPSLHFSVADPGDYLIEATLADENGTKLDTKSGIITVTGEALPPLPAEGGERGRDRDKDMDKDRDHDEDRDRDQDKEKKKR